MKLLPKKIAVHAYSFIYVNWLATGLTSIGCAVENAVSDPRLRVHLSCFRDVRAGRVPRPSPRTVRRVTYARALSRREGTTCEGPRAHQHRQTDYRVAENRMHY